MERTLGEHVTSLQNRIQSLRKQLTDPTRTEIEGNRIQTEIQVAELALGYYRKAFELEREIA